MKRWIKFEKYLFLFFVGGCAYYLLEILLRGYSHYSMFLLGWTCFIVCGLLNESVRFHLSLLSQMFLSSLIITGLEFMTGCIVNLWLGWHIWDYSKLPFNFKGQICLHFSVIWFFLSLVAILLDDYLRYRFFGEEKMHYKIIARRK